MPTRKAQSVLCYAILCRLASTASYRWHVHWTVHVQVHELLRGNHRSLRSDTASTSHSRFLRNILKP